MSLSIREISQIQLADGTTLDGDRLEQFLDDLVNRINALRASDLYRRLIPTTFVGGYDQADSAQGQLPWLINYNEAGEVVLGGSQPPLGFTNQYRLKGTEVPEIDVTTSATTEEQFAWTNALYFRKPVVLHCVSFTFQQFEHAWLYVGAAPTGSVVGDAVNDVYLDVSIDNPFLTEDRRLADSEVHRIRFRLDGDFFSNVGVANVVGAYADMEPNRAKAVRMEAVHIDLRNLDIPLHRDTRLRFSVVVPRYNGADPYGWTAEPYTLSNYSWSVTVLEGLES